MTGTTVEQTDTDVSRQPGKDAFETERDRISARRHAMEQGSSPWGIWGLALSGGGIRSATIGFGAMQALAGIAAPTESAPSQHPRHARTTATAQSADAQPAKISAPSLESGNAPSRPLLSRFDYLSTVSGGGYIGAFFCSLFVPGRLRANSSAVEAALDAYSTMATVPPGRLRSTDRLDPDDIGSCSTAWLRENGRYLAPTGAGDYLYAAATAIRNWMAVHYVLGTLFLSAFSIVALARLLLAKSCPWYASQVEIPLLVGAYGTIWWSPLWWLTIAFVVLWIAPCGLAYWLSYPHAGQSEMVKPRVFGTPALSTAGLCLLFAVTALLLRHYTTAQYKPLVYVSILVTAVTFIGFVIHVFNAWRADSVSSLRVIHTRAASKGIAWVIGISILAIADTAGQEIYLLFVREVALWKPLSVPAILGGVVWLVRKLARLFDESKSDSSFLKRIPIALIAGIAGATMLLLVACVWNVLVQWVSWLGPTTEVALTSNARLWTLVALLGVSLLLAWTAGRFSGFINLSTLQAVYGSRLTRAYLGASNGARFRPDAPPAARSAAEPIPSDQLDLSTYYSADSLAPVHLINVTLNQTVDPTEQLIQRDRKGKPLTVSPAGFCFDGDFRPLDRSTASSVRSFKTGRDTQPMSLGQWIGTSGAAFTTGLGRATTFGTSLALGLANVRLGTWWSSGQGEDASRGLERLFKDAFRTQAFLIYELFARFHGLRREWQYLSDGGHFENTAAYELLRRQRGVRLIVVCDNGCDPQYRFDDLANLIRLARIDFELEIEVDCAIGTDPVLGQVFGNLGDFQPTAPASNKCAILLNVYPCGGTIHPRVPISRIVLLKPRVIESAPADIHEYSRANPDFPQQTTANQFFDEAQWESYRDLGYRIALRVFGTDTEGAVGTALWEYLSK